MQHSTVTMSDIRALLTLGLLKTGTTSAEIRTSLQLAATSRAMAAEEYSCFKSDGSELPPAHNVARLYPNAEVEISARNKRMAFEAMNSDVMALLTLSLLKVGTSAEEIQKALRLAAQSRVAEGEETVSAARPAVTPEAPAPVGGGASLASKQALLNELLFYNASQAVAQA